jgi:hypothetical protein
MARYTLCAWPLLLLLLYLLLLLLPLPLVLLLLLLVYRITQKLLLLLPLGSRIT